MDYKKINESLKSFSGLRNKLTPVNKKVVNEITNDYGSQGDSNEIYEVYDIGLPNDMYIKLEINSDSYGEDEYVAGVSFVKGVKKVTVVFEY